jgi:hypothetical protein
LRLRLAQALGRRLLASALEEEEEEARGGEQGEEEQGLGESLGAAQRATTEEPVCSVQMNAYV